MEDWELLAAYALRRDEAAFTTLVERHRHWVYWACARRMRDSTLAEDATQAVFIVLSRHAVKLARKGRGMCLEAWLHEAVRMAAANLMREERRRKEREMTVAAIRSEVQECASVWQKMESQVDMALDQLSAGDREALLLRFFRRLTYAEIGGRLSVSEEAATKRVNRALERLRQMMTKEGMQASASMMGAALWAYGVGPVPPGAVAKLALVGSAAGSVGTSGQAAAIAQGMIHMMQVARMKIVAFAAVAAAILVAAPLLVTQVWGNRVASNTPGGGFSASTSPVSPASPAEWIPKLNGCLLEQSGSKLRISGINNIDGWGYGNGISSTKSLPDGDFYASVDFMVARFQEGTPMELNPPVGGESASGQTLVYLRGATASGNAIAILYEPKAGRYRIQGWSTPNNIFSQPAVRGFGDENRVYHHLRLKYEAASQTAAGWVDDRFIGAIRYPMRGAITFGLLANTDRKGMEIDMRFDNFASGSDISNAPPTPAASGSPGNSPSQEAAPEGAPGLP